MRTTHSRFAAESSAVNRVAQAVHQNLPAGDAADAAVAFEQLGCRIVTTTEDGVLLVSPPPALDQVLEGDLL